MTIPRFDLSDDEVHQIEALLSDLASRFETVEDQDFLMDLGVYAQELPRRLRRALYRFRLEEPASAVLLLGGFPVDEKRIGATPLHWNHRVDPSPTLREELMILLGSSLLGEPFGWGTQQDGFLVHDILPIPGREKEQLGSGCEELLEWHTEDAFHPFCGDYLVLMCMRNPLGIPTTFASLENVVLSDEERTLLFEPLYPIVPDESHLVKFQSNGHAADESQGKAYEEMERMSSETVRIPVLSGAPESPYVRIDRFTMEDPEDERALAALEGLAQQIEANIVDLVLRPGEICFIDNYKGVHGRKPFKARYDGQDRWLKRVNVARDLRRSRHVRTAAVDRVIYGG